ncbi:MAG: hypothetical protein PHN78_08655 [Dehalococcoidales bacterium]|nr:hypothetical protein [Dehalococcoidales bacterium]
MVSNNSETSNDKYIKKESGGRSHIILVTRVHKEASDEKMYKLADEIKFLENIPLEWKQHFPPVTLSYVGNDKVYYEMPHYNLPTLRRLLFSGVFKHQDALKWLDRMLEFSFEMYRKEVIPLPPEYLAD